MKTFRSKSGPFREQPFFEPGEIDRICLQELLKLKLLPDAPSPVRIDRFLERRFKVSPEYGDLNEGVLGYTKFGKDGVQAIVIARSLDEEGTETAERRIRTTMAHEAGHGLLHSQLFALGEPTPNLFDGESGVNCQILCRDVVGHQQVGRKYDGRWWEYHANQAIGGLLMPRKLINEALKPFLVSTGNLGGVTIDPARHEAAVRTLAETFQVNPIVARIRIQDLYPAEKGGQMTL